MNHIDNSKAHRIINRDILTKISEYANVNSLSLVDTNFRDMSKNRKIKENIRTKYYDEFIYVKSNLSFYYIVQKVVDEQDFYMIEKFIQNYLNYNDVLGCIASILSLTDSHKIIDHTISMVEINDIKNIIKIISNSNNVKYILEKYKITNTESSLKKVQILSISSQSSKIEKFYNKKTSFSELLNKFKESTISKIENKELCNQIIEKYKLSGLFLVEYLSLVLFLKHDKCLNRINKAKDFIYNIYELAYCLLICAIKKKLTKDIEKYYPFCIIQCTLFENKEFTQNAYKYIKQDSFKFNLVGLDLYRTFQWYFKSDFSNNSDLLRIVFELRDTTLTNSVFESFLYEPSLVADSISIINHFMCNLSPKSLAYIIENKEIEKTNLSLEIKQVCLYILLTKHEENEMDYDYLDSLVCSELFLKNNVSKSFYFNNICSYIEPDLYNIAKMMCYKDDKYKNNIYRFLTHEQENEIKKILSELS